MEASGIEGRDPSREVEVEFGCGSKMEIIINIIVIIIIIINNIIITISLPLHQWAIEMISLSQVPVGPSVLRACFLKKGKIIPTTLPISPGSKHQIQTIQSVL